jgi:hypothetical protein
MRQYLWLVLLLAIAVLALGGALKLSLKGDGHLQYETEWVRALLQIGLVAVFGIVTSVVLEHFKDTLQQRRDDSKLRFTVLAEVTRAYNDVKLVRRKIQAGEAFTETIADRLNQSQLTIEFHKRNSTRLFHQANELHGFLYEMEHYLNKVANEPDSEQRRGFDSKGFKKSFSVPHAEAATLIRNEIGGRVLKNRTHEQESEKRDVAD